jgi:hypothetical protein
MLALKNSRVNFKKLFKYKKRNDIQQMKKITYYNTDLEKYVEIEVPININIVTESERFDTQKMLAIGYEKSKIKNKQEENKQEENKTISNIYDSYLDSVIYATHSTLPFIEDFGKGTLPFKEDFGKGTLPFKEDFGKGTLPFKEDFGVFDDCLENDVYNIYNAFDVSSFYSDINYM